MLDILSRRNLSLIGPSKLQKYQVSEISSQRRNCIIDCIAHSVFKVLGESLKNSEKALKSVKNTEKTEKSLKIAAFGGSKV